MDIVEWLRAQGDPVTIDLVAEILAYESGVDGEFACCHTAEEIGSGQCRGTKPSEIRGLQLLALRHADAPGYQPKWKVTG